MILNTADNIMSGINEVQMVKCNSVIVWKRSAPSPSRKLSGTPPLVFYTTGTTLNDYTISGASGGVGDGFDAVHYRITIAMINKNLYGYQITSEEGGYLLEDGTIQTQTLNNYNTSGFIPIPSGISRLTYSFRASRMGSLRGIMVCAYDSSRNFISAPVYTVDTFAGDSRYSYPFDVPTGTAFIRASYITDAHHSAMISSDYEMQIEVGDTATAYVGSRVIRDYIVMDAPLYSGDSYNYDGSVTVGTTANSWNFIFVETTVQPENVTIWYEGEAD